MKIRYGIAEYVRYINHSYLREVKDKPKHVEVNNLMMKL